MAADFDTYDYWRERAQELYADLYEAKNQIALRQQEVERLWVCLARYNAVWENPDKAKAGRQEVERLRALLEELGDYIRRGRGSDYATMREILDRQHSAQLGS